MSGAVAPFQIDAAMRRQRQVERDAAAAGAVPAGPIVLIPTPAQLAAGVRQVDARETQIPRTAATLATRLRDAGYGVRVTYALAEIPATARREAALCETIAVRVRAFPAVDPDADMWGNLIRGALGWAIWKDGKADDANWRGSRCNVTEFGRLALAAPSDGTL